MVHRAFGALRMGPAIPFHQEKIIFSLFTNTIICSAGTMTGFLREHMGRFAQSPHPSYHTDAFKREDGCTEEQQEVLPACHQGQVAGIWNLLKGRGRRALALPWHRYHCLAESWANPDIHRESAMSTQEIPRIAQPSHLLKSYSCGKIHIA